MAIKEGSRSTSESTPIQLVTPEAAGRMLALGRARVYQLIADGTLRSMKIGRSRRISTRAIEEFIAERERAA